jgi:transcriptional regulator GlxA family with amidase domain
MRVAILAFPGMTALDAIGPHEVLSRVPGAEVCFVAPAKGTVPAEGGLSLAVDRDLDEVDSADVVLVPGGPGTRELLSEHAVLEWLRQLDKRTRWTTSVCTGSLVLGAAGLLEGKRATSHWIWREYLAAFGAEPVNQRVVEDGKLLTAAGVSAGIDMALHLVAREVGEVAAQAIQLSIEYDPSPPFATGSPERAPAELVERIRDLARSDPALSLEGRVPERRA